MPVSTLLGDLDALAVARIREFAPPEGYHLAFSGGKDSVVLLDLAERSGVKFDSHFYLTTLDPPELVSFVHRYYSRVQRHRPERTFENMLLEEGFPPLRQNRWCCHLLKEHQGGARTILTGVRWEESRARGKRRMVERCVRGADRSFVHPIIDWTSEDVWAYIRERRLPYCILYDEGKKRIGCLFCPCARKTSRMADAERYPKMVRRFVLAFDRLVEKRRADGRPLKMATTGQELFDWWLEEKCSVEAEVEGQCSLYNEGDE